ncbi:uncharacterized protein J3D65DRAFT_280127 [Phyllosticta citribraziliensis]|uniref:Uncharacterized protein n=1 Tax=Phyllosticta citribraziliensis TaxID=989973 RepID=A0ABR1LW67_9PEZI
MNRATAADSNDRPCGDEQLSIRAKTQNPAHGGGGLTANLDHVVREWSQTSSDRTRDDSPDRQDSAHVFLEDRRRRRTASWHAKLSRGSSRPSDRPPADGGWGRQPLVVILLVLLVLLLLLLRLLLLLLRPARRVLPRVGVIDIQEPAQQERQSARRNRLT